MGGACSIGKPSPTRMLPVTPDKPSEPPASKARTRSVLGAGNEPSAAFIADHAAKTTTKSERRASTKLAGSVKLGELDFTKTLEHQEASSALMAFARADYSEENLEFYQEMQDFRTSWDAKEGDEAARQALSQSLIDRFLKAGAPKQVCIGDRKVAGVLELAAGGTFSRDMFDEAQAIARRTLQEDIFPRFQDSEAGKELAKRPELCSSATGDSSPGGSPAGPA